MQPAASVEDLLARSGTGDAEFGASRHGRPTMSPLVTLEPLTPAQQVHLRRRARLPWRRAESRDAREGVAVYYTGPLRVVRATTDHGSESVRLAIPDGPTFSSTAARLVDALAQRSTGLLGTVVFTPRSRTVLFVQGDADDVLFDTTVGRKGMLHPLQT